MDDLVAEVDALPDVLVRSESWETLWPDSRELMLAHKVETGQTDPRQDLAPDHQAILRMERGGGLLVIAAREETSEAKLVGYSIWYLTPSLETSGLLVGMQAPWYVVPSWRKRGVGLLLWEESEKLLRSREVRLISGHWPAEGAGAASLASFFKRKGARVIGTEFSLWLDGTS